MTYPAILYAVFNAVGLLAAYLVARRLNRSTAAKRVSRGMVAAVIVGGILGAKIPVWLAYGFSPMFYWDGKSLFGGLLGGFFAMNLYKTVCRIPDGGFGDRFVIPLCLAAGFGKLGCFFNGCCGGREFLGLVQPTQLYESAFQFLLALLFYVLYRTGRAGGLWFPIYMVLYMTMRFAIEFLRNEPVFAFHLTVYQILALVFLPVFAIIIYCRLKEYVDIDR